MEAAQHAAVKQAAQNAFEEQQQQQQHAYALATQPWREEGGGDHRPVGTAGYGARHVITRILNPHFLSHIASHDVGTDG